MSRRLELFAVFLLALLTAPACLAGQYTFSGGHIHVNIPDAWSRIMRSHGDPESMVFQVPDLSPTGHRALARVTVTSQRVRNIAAFRRFVERNAKHAKALPDFRKDTARSTPTLLRYTAREGSTVQTYVEHYSFHDGYAVMVRCVRPSHSQAGAAWIAGFDRGCADINASIH